MSSALNWGDNSDYLGIFIPGGHGALIGLPASIEVKNLLEWAIAHDKFIISLCQGPAAFLSVERSDLFAGYKIYAFPDTLDAQTPEITYARPPTWKWRAAGAMVLR
jgi:molecular chaperone Hsp31 and glyoxalase 3